MMNNEFFRDFKGVWIPKEIWLCEDLSLLEKILWVEVDSLYDEDSGGCFASNEYLCQFLGIKERRLQEMIKNLKNLNLLEIVSFDGRKRILKALPVSGIKSSCGAEVQKSAGQNRSAEKCRAEVQKSAGLTNIYNKEDNKEKKDKGRSIKKLIEQNNGTVPEGYTRFGEYVVMKDSSYRNFVNEHGTSLVHEIFQRIEDHCVNNKPQGYNCYEAVFRTFLNNTNFQNLKNRPNSAAAAIPEWKATQEKLHEFCRNTANLCESDQIELKVESNAVTFIPLQGQRHPWTIKFSDPGAEEQIKNEISKRNFRKKRN